MKTWILATTFAVLACQAATAQQGGSFAAPGRGEIREARPQRPEEFPRPKTHGAIVMMSERGLQVLSPGAPASLGRGETILSANIAPEGRIGDEKQDRKPFGGIQLFGWVF